MLDIHKTQWLEQQKRIREMHERQAMLQIQRNKEKGLMFDVSSK